MTLRAPCWDPTPRRSSWRPSGSSSGLNQPLWEQYWHWLPAALHGDLGSSLISRQPVTDAAQRPARAVPVADRRRRPWLPRSSGMALGVRGARRGALGRGRRRRLDRRPRRPRLLAGARPGRRLRGAAGSCSRRPATCPSSTTRSRGCKSIVLPVITLAVPAPSRSSPSRPATRSPPPWTVLRPDAARGRCRRAVDRLPARAAQRGHPHPDRRRPGLRRRAERHRRRRVHLRHPRAGQHRRPGHRLARPPAHPGVVVYFTLIVIASTCSSTSPTATSTRGALVMTATIAQIEPPLTPPPEPGDRHAPAPARPPPGSVAAERLAVIYLVLLVLAGLLARRWLRFRPEQQDLADVLTGPSSSHLLGTDTLGRDVLSRLLYGILPSLRTPSIASSCSSPSASRSASSPATAAAARQRRQPHHRTRAVHPADHHRAGRPRRLLRQRRRRDGHPRRAGAPGLIRVVRGATLSVREELYVTAAEVAGVRPPRIMSTHVLPPRPRPDPGPGHRLRRHRPRHPGRTGLPRAAQPPATARPGAA